MTHNLLANLVHDLWDDMHIPGILCQVGAIVVSIGLGWGLTYFLRKTYKSKKDKFTPVVRFGIGSFVHVLAPLLTLTLFIVSKLALEKLQHVNLLQVAIPLMASFALIRLVFYILRRIFMRQNNLASTLLLLEKLFATLIWSSVALYITGLWPDLLSYMNETVIPFGRHKIAVSTILQAVISVVSILIIALWAGTALEERLMQMHAIHTSLRVVMARMARALLILIGLLISLSMAGIDLTVLSVFGGALGVGLGLGLQKIAGNYVSGFVILLDRSISIDDMIMVDKYYGKVTHINSRYTILQGMDGIESIIPNEMLVFSPVQNYSLSNRSVRLATQITIDYQSDVTHVLHLLETEIAAIKRIATTPAPQALLLKLGDNGLDLEIGFWIADPENGRTNILSEVNQTILRVLQAHNVNIPYPQRDIRIVSNQGNI